MLVLTRMKNERILIGDDVSVMIVDVRGDKVRLGIVAPTSIAVHREEVVEKIHAERESERLLEGVEVVMGVRVEKAVRP